WALGEGTFCACDGPRTVGEESDSLASQTGARLARKLVEEIRKLNQLGECRLLRLAWPTLPTICVTEALAASAKQRGASVDAERASTKTRAPSSTADSTYLAYRGTQSSSAASQRPATWVEHT